MRVCVFVDGESLRHVIGDLFIREQFDDRDYLPKEADWAKWFDALVGQATEGRGSRLRTYWYVVHYVDPYPNPLRRFLRTPERLEMWSGKNRRFLKRQHSIDGLDAQERTKKLTSIQEHLHERRIKIKSRFDGFLTVQGGIAGHHRAIEFRRSGAIGYDLFSGQLGQEKTVDVNLAVDLLLFRESYDLALIVSGDQDYVPAVEAVKNSGKQVVNVGFLRRDGKLLPGGAARLNQVTDWSIKVEYEDLRAALKLPEMVGKPKEDHEAPQ